VGTVVTHWLIKEYRNFYQHKTEKLDLTYHVYQFLSEMKTRNPNVNLFSGWPPYLGIIRILYGYASDRESLLMHKHHLFPPSVSFHAKSIYPAESPLYHIPFNSQILRRPWTPSAHLRLCSQIIGQMSPATSCRLAYTKLPRVMKNVSDRFKGKHFHHL
jgi:hypothetical protein